MTEPTLLLDASDIERAMIRMAHEIAERNSGDTDLILVGIQRGGVYLAHRLAAVLERILGRPLTVGTLDISMHRDDLDQRLTPHVHPTTIPCDVNGKTVVLVDDVLYSGRTTRAAMDSLTDLGRPKSIQLAVLIDRGHRQLPIRADFVGKNLPTAIHERINVKLREEGGEEAVYLERT